MPEETVEEVIRTIRRRTLGHHGSSTLAYALEVHLSLEASLALLLELVVAHPSEFDLQRMPFAEKSRWVFALGLLPLELKGAVNAVNRMRNGFAHRVGHMVDDKLLATMTRAAPYLLINLDQWLESQGTGPHGEPVVWTDDRKREEVVFHLAEQLTLRVLTACDDIRSAKLARSR